MRKSIIMTGLVLLVWTAALSASPSLRANWSPPTEGSPAVEYEIELVRDGEPEVIATVTDGNTFTLTSLDINIPDPS
jgi:hypothetical protein